MEEGCDAVASTKEDHACDWFLEPCAAFREVPRWYGNNKYLDEASSLIKACYQIVNANVICAEK